MELTRKKGEVSVCMAFSLFNYSKTTSHLPPTQRKPHQKEYTKMDPSMLFHMMGKGGGKGGGGKGGKGSRSMKPQSIAAPVEVTLLQLYKGEGEGTMDMDELANDEMKEMKVGGKYTVEVKPGMRPGARVPFPGQGIQLPGLEERGDLAAIIELPETPDTPGFTLSDDDLVSSVDVTLSQALCGFCIEFCHVDGSLLLLNHSKVCSPGDILTVPNKGMPFEDGSRGNLLLKVNISFPRVLEEDQIAAIQPLLPTRSMIGLYDEEPTTVHIDDMQKEEWKAKTEAENDSDDEDDGPQTMQCAHQ